MKLKMIKQVSQGSDDYSTKGAEGVFKLGGPGIEVDERTAERIQRDHPGCFAEDKGEVKGAVKIDKQAEEADDDEE